MSRNQWRILQFLYASGHRQARHGDIASELGMTSVIVGDACRRLIGKGYVRLGLLAHNKAAEYRTYILDEPGLRLFEPRPAALPAPPPSRPTAGPPRYRLRVSAHSQQTLSRDEIEVLALQAHQALTARVPSLLVKVSFDRIGSTPWPEDTPLEQLPLETRTFNGLKRAGYRTVGQVADLADEDLQDIRSFGPGSIADLRQTLQSGPPGAGPQA